MRTVGFTFFDHGCGNAEKIKTMSTPGAINRRPRQRSQRGIGREVLKKTGRQKEVGKAKPLLEQIDAGTQTARGGALLKSALAKACVPFAAIYAP